jgi:signal transduction histidine kinase/serine phosphatase RsbU (regulator of sigma subunit)
MGVEPVRWPETLLISGSANGRLIYERDWSATALGPIAAWPQSLRTIVIMAMESSAQMYIAWGPARVALYNDAYNSIAGGHHPRIFGLPTAEAWAEVYESTLKPLFDDVIIGANTLTMHDQHFPIMRFGFVEDFFCTLSYSPLRDESGNVAGLLAVVTETTQTVLSRRRMETLRDLAGDTAEALSEAAIGDAFRNALADKPDLPFARLYLRDELTSTMRLASSVGDDPSTDEWPLEVVMRLGEPTAVQTAGRGSALLLPIAAQHHRETIGVLVAGINPRVQLDEAYRRFLTLLAGQIGGAVISVRAFEAARTRAEALAELDRAKTNFFNNVSHEFRTPLTLMLGPLEDLLADHEGVDVAARSEITLVHRNALRLQRLVNALLEFSRVEAGRQQTNFQTLDLAAYTQGLVAQFAPVMQTAGLEFLIDIRPTGDDVWVDSEMWETIVLNLLSNAFKFTFEGQVSVVLERTGDCVALTVGDSGTGIAPAQLDHIFERFHRIDGARSRTHEGSGIGLALVRELVKAHGGEITVQSEVGGGTEFTVRLPVAAQTALTTSQSIVMDPTPATLAPVAKRAGSFAAEAMRWVESPQAELATRPLTADEAAMRRLMPAVIVAEDNADMREYIERLLQPHYRVTIVSNGAQALDAAREHTPDLILTDVMMPVMDGFALLKAVRSDTKLKAVPVVMLSARAVEGSAVEGLEQGADDYVVKPFSARELIARVNANIALARLRREYEREHRVADSFQRASLPQELPTVPGLTFNAIYSPGGNDAQVGGDWYDAVRLLDGRVVVSIGDVAGSGVRAAVTMGNMRQIIRGIAQVHADPVLMLNAADRALRSEHPELFVTAFVGILDPATRTLTYASAGHPPPYVRMPNGDVVPLAETGLPLGLRHSRVDNLARTVAIPDGALLVMYTDGLTEATRDALEGDARVRSALRRDEIARATNPAEALQHAVLDDGATGDDVAILTVWLGSADVPLSGAPLTTRWKFEADNAIAAQRARREFGDALRERGASFEDIYTAEVVFGELVGNVVRYAPGMAEVTVDWSGPLPVLHVVDDGPGFRHHAFLPNDIYAESGRGLYLITMLTEDFHVTKRPERGSHARAVLSLDRHRLANASSGPDRGGLLDALMTPF